MVRGKFKEVWICHVINPWKIIIWQLFLLTGGIFMNGLCSFDQYPNHSTCSYLPPASDDCSYSQSFQTLRLTRKKIRLSIITIMTKLCIPIGWLGIRHLILTGVLLTNAFGDCLYFFISDILTKRTDGFSDYDNVRIQ